MGNKKIDYENISETSTITNRVILRKNKGLYSLVLITGLPGTGKSYLSLRLGELIYKKIGGNMKISPDDIVDNFIDLVRRVKKVKPGSFGEVIIIEELSVLFPSKRAMSRDNVDVGKILDTCRELQIILIANAPIYATIDSHLRSMSTILIQTMKVVRSAEICISKAWILQTDPHTGKTYRHKFHSTNGRDIDRHLTRVPSKELLLEYGKKKVDFREELYNRIESEAVARDNKLKKEKPLTLTEKDLTPLQWEVYNLKFKKKMEQKEIAIQLNQDQSRISKVVKRIREIGAKSLGKSTKGGQ